VSDVIITDSDVLACVRDGEQLEHPGYQGNIHTGRIGERRILIKSAAGRGITALLNRRMLQREYRIYDRLAGVSGIPHCYGFFMGRYLVLENVQSHTLRHAAIGDREKFFVEMLATIKAIHSRGVAHGDLKRKENVLVTHDSRPCLIDFGVSTIRKPGFHPLNHFWYDFSHQHDFNAWVKHKYDRKFQDITPEDTQYHRPLRIEIMARTIKKIWIKLRRGGKPAVSPD
jgi:serine/threonine protein kinase